MKRDDTPDERMEAMVAGILRFGVLASFALVLAGSVWMFASGSTGYAGLDAGGQTIRAALSASSLGGALRVAPTSPLATVQGVLAGKPYALIALGLLVLIATPVLRVVASVVTFARRRDRAYTLITAYVLLVLIVSFVLGRAG